jgi:hypothetical protein
MADTVALGPKVYPLVPDVGNDCFNPLWPGTVFSRVP